MSPPSSPSPDKLALSGKDRFGGLLCDLTSKRPPVPRRGRSTGSGSCTIRESTSHTQDPSITFCRGELSQIRKGKSSLAPVLQMSSLHGNAAGDTNPADQDLQDLPLPMLGAQKRLGQTVEHQVMRQQKLSEAVRMILECIGEDVNREGLLRTPERYAKAMLYFTRGYEQSLDSIIGEAVFTENHDEMVIVKDIEVMSLCEHHLVPFMGKMHIGYIPRGRVLGLSKFARIADMFSRRLQIQERLTKEVAAAIQGVLIPQGVAVVMESSHLCMVMRGVQQTQSQTTTSCMLGIFRENAGARKEFLNLIK